MTTENDRRHMLPSSVLPLSYVPTSTQNRYWGLTYNCWLVSDTFMQWVCSWELGLFNIYCGSFGCCIVVQSFSGVQLFVTPQTIACHVSQSFTVSWSLLQTHGHGVSDAIQPSHPLSSPSPPAFKLSQEQGLLQWISSLHQVAKVLKLQQSVLPMNIQGWFPLGLTGLTSSLSEGSLSLL